MKRTLLFIACVLASLTMLAQEPDYLPFIEAGKKWHVVRSEFDRGYHFDQFMLMNEEVKKDGKTYMKMYRTEDLLTVVHEVGLLREEDRKVYFFDNDMQKEYLIFDFSLQAGDIYETYSYDEQKMVTYKVISVGDYQEGPEVIRYTEETDSTTTQHCYLRKWTVRRTDNNLQKTWIEGVGSLEGPLANLYDERPVSVNTNLAYVEFGGELYLPFSFYDTMNNQVHGCNLPTGAENREDDDTNHHLIYELEGDRLHVYGEVFTQCGPNNYAYFFEKPTDDPSVHKIEFFIQDVAPSANCMALHATDFYVPGFDPSLNYIVVDYQGVEHPVINKTPQMAYRPLVEKGKVWTYHYHGLNGQEFNVDRIIDGDTIIGGLTYKKIYDKVGGQYQYALREDGKKIYIVYPHYETASLLYDFSKNAGDVINELAYPLIVASVDTIDIDGVKFRRMRVQDANQPVKEWSDDLIHLYNFWIEGVGSECLLEASIREPGNAYNLVSCQINGRVYTQQELLGIVSKPTPQYDYIPFVKEGKKWNVVRSDFDRGYHFDQFTLMNEAIVKDGKTYMKMHRSEDDLTVTYDAGLLREEDRKVYFFDSGMQKEFLLFDYSMKTGDTYETYSYDEQKMVTYKVVSVGDYREGPKVERSVYNQAADSAETQHRYLQKWIVCRTGNEALQKTWIEGIGSLEGPLANLYDERPVSVNTNLAYVEFGGELYLPFSFYDTMNNQVHGCNLPTGAENREDDDTNHHLIYELEGDRLHVYGEVFTQCGPNNYAYFIEKPTDDPTLHKLEFIIQDVAPSANCMALHATNFYATGFDPNLNYVVVDNRGEKHPVINKMPQMAYRPMIEDGKVWKTGDTSVNPVQSVAFYYFDGDTIINGKVCKQMMCQLYYGPDYHNDAITFPIPALRYIGAWYEEDKKVYYYDINNQLKMMYDFSIEANDTLLVDNEYQFVVGPKQTGGLKGFKGVYRDIMWYWSGSGSSNYSTTWLEGVGSIDGPTSNVFYSSVKRPPLLMSCTVGDEVIYLDDSCEDGATPETSNASKQRFDFSHTIKTKPKAPMRRGEETALYGEYSEQQLAIHLNPLDDAYLVRITDETDKVVYEKAINAGSIVGLNIDISAYAKGRYTVIVENSNESFTGEFEAQTTGIEAIKANKEDVRSYIYNLQGQRLSTLQKGLNIVNGQKIYVK